MRAPIKVAQGTWDWRMYIVLFYLHWNHQELGKADDLQQ